MNTYIKVLKIVDEIKSVNLNSMFVSIEDEHVNDLSKFLESQNIHVNVDSWNHPQSLYVGENMSNKNLTVLRLSW